MVFANFIAQRQQVNFGDKIFTPKFTASDVPIKNAGALFTTTEERDRILNLPSTGTSGVSDCPINFNAVNATYLTNTGVDNYFKLLTINGTNITIQVHDPINGGYITLPPRPIIEMNSISDYNPSIAGVYVNVTSTVLTIGGAGILISQCGAIPIVI
jgi:hypothetical protein